MKGFFRNHIPAMLAALLVLPGMASPVVAAQLYDVEVIVFSNRSGADDGEQMRSPSMDAAHASGVFPQDQFTELAPRLYTMDSIRSTLAASRGYAVLFHRAWRQLSYDRENAVDYPVHTFSDNGRDSIEGTVTLIRERYLHLDIDLLLMSAGSSAPVQYSDGPGSVPAYRLSEKRRIRSGELHYFDHPRFGVIARVTPYESPEQPAAPPEVEEVITEEEPVPADAAPPVTQDEQLTR